MKSPPLDVAAAARVTNSQRFNLRDVGFVAVQATHLASPEPGSPMLLDWETPPVTAVWNLSDAGLKVVLPMTLFIDAVEETEAATRTRVAEVSVVLRMDYQVADAPGESFEEDLPNYVGICGYLHAWPYFRSEVQWLTAKLGFPPLVLPVVVSGDAANRVTVRGAHELQEDLKPTAKKIASKTTPKKLAKKSAKQA